MANNQRRMVYSKIWTSQQFGRLSPKARLLFIGMITLADDDGRLVGEAAYLRGQIFPYDDINPEEMKALKKEVVDLGLIESYEVNSFDYLQHPKWIEYQKIRRDLYVTSTLPARNGTVTGPLRKRDTSKDKISKDKIILSSSPKGDGSVFSEHFNRFWDSYPRKVGKKAAWNAWRKAEIPPKVDILEVIKKQKQSVQWKREGGQFIPHPATWLNQGRWADEIEPEKNNNFTKY